MVTRYSSTKTILKLPPPVGRPASKPELFKDSADIPAAPRPHRLVRIGPTILLLTGACQRANLRRQYCFDSGRESKGRMREHLALWLFAIGMIGLGTLTILSGDFALVWQPVPVGWPGRLLLANLSGLVMLGGGLLCFPAQTRLCAVRVLFTYVCLWTLLKLPPLLTMARHEFVWLGFGEVAVLASGAAVLYLQQNQSAKNLHGKLTAARLIFGFWLLPIGLSHIVYLKETTAFVPAWLPFRHAIAASTGAAQILSGLCVLFLPWRALGAAAEAVLLSSFTLLVWIPAIVSAPSQRLPWTGFLISWSIASAAWAFAGVLSQASARPWTTAGAAHHSSRENIPAAQTRAGSTT